MKKVIKKELTHKEELDILLDKGKKNGVLTYEELMEVGEKNLTEKELNDFMRLLEKEHIELIMQDELDKNNSNHDMEDEPSGKTTLKKGLDLDLDSDIKTDDELDIEDTEELIKSSDNQLNDCVKAYLRDIGKIPLLNKKTETIIAQKIAQSKSDSIDAIGQFPFVAKDLISLGEKIKKDAVALKDIIQFAEYDEDNLPKLEEERDNLLAQIKKIQNLIANEPKIYLSYKGKLTSTKIKNEMLDKIQQNKINIIEEIKSIRIA